jgi:hypothetical protein
MAAAVAKRDGAETRYGASANQPHYTKASPTLLALEPSEAKNTPPSIMEQSEWAAVYQHVESRYQALYTWRLPWWTTWQQIARYMMPRRNYLFITANMYDRGLRQDFSIVDRTGTLAGQTCASGLMAGLTDPDRRWLVLGPGIPDFEPDQDGQRWYEEVSERLNYVYTHSNFYDAQAQHYEDVVFFGTGTVIDYEDEDEIIHCFTPCAGEFLLGANFEFGNDVLYREYRMTVSQMVEMFGLENCPEETQRMWRAKGGALEFENVIGHAIEPNFAIQGGQRDQSVGVVPGGFTWREVYWVRGRNDCKPLSIAGFHEQPFAASRWNTQANDAYGRGVGEDMLADVIQLQLETRQKAESIEKVNRPPMGADVSLQNLPMSVNPGKITYFNTGANGEKKFFPLYEIKPDINAIVADIQLIQERIGRTAFNHVFQPMEDLRNETKTQITATEVDAIKEERLLPLGPIFGRIYGSLRQRVKRHLRILARRGLLPPKPASLRGVPTHIDFVSMLTQAQKATATAATARGAQFIGSLSGAWPEAKFLLDVEKTSRDFVEGVGAPANMLVSPQEFKRRVAQGVQQSKEAQAMNATLPGAQAAKALSEAKTGPGNALSALVSGQ